MVLEDNNLHYPPAPGMRIVVTRGGGTSMETSRHDATQERTRAAMAIMPETFVRNWQMTGLRVLRAQERMLHGMMSAARLEMQFGQDLIMNRMARLNTRNENGPRDGAFQELDRMITLMREV